MGLWWNTTTNIQPPTDGDWKGGAGGRAELSGLLLRLMRELYTSCSCLQGNLISQELTPKLNHLHVYGLL